MKEFFFRYEYFYKRPDANKAHYIPILCLLTKVAAAAR